MTANDGASPLPGYQPTANGPAEKMSTALPGPTSVTLGFDNLSEPVFPPAAWLEETGLADHPLLRGLLLELPPKGSAPSPEWLNRWFEAARAILELLYVAERR